MKIFLPFYPLSLCQITPLKKLVQDLRPNRIYAGKITEKKHVRNTKMVSGVFPLREWRFINNQDLKYGIHTKMDAF